VLDFKGYGWMLVDGTRMTVQVGIMSLVLAIILGLIGAGMKLSGSRLARAIAETYTTVIRGIPELVLLLLVFFGGTVLLQKLVKLFSDVGYVEVDAFTAGMCTIGFVYGAYATEVFRGAFLAVPKGQIEAAHACGMNRWLTLRRIVLPQVWRFALPGLGNVWLVLLKATSLISVVGLEELTRKAQIAYGATRQPFTFLAASAVIYLGLTIISMIVLQVAERRAARGVRMA
jgi:His/Glu/Gln/Arg/opine family amino acid ABC transporter permease subunit